MTRTAHSHTPSTFLPLRRPAVPWVVLATLLSVSTALSVSTVEAQDRYIAFGDSVTEGFGFDGDCMTDCGYPSRLEGLLQADGLAVTVENYGLGGERTPTGVDRIEQALMDANAGPNDLVLLMEGTNDITQQISPETTLFNLDSMARKALQRGAQTLHATLIPRFPDATVDAENVLNEQMARNIRDLSFSSTRDLVDPFEVFSQTPNLFEDFYSEQMDFFDPVGHPNPAGFDLLAEIFYDVLTGNDTVPPVIGSVAPAPGSVDVGSLATVTVRLYDFGSGIDTGSVSLTLDGVPVSLDLSTGGENWLDVVHQPFNALDPGNTTVRVQASDRVFPGANSMNREATRFSVTADGTDACVPDATVLCLDDQPGDRRFRIRMSWETSLNGGQAGQAFATPLAPLGLPSGGLLSFFEQNPEVLIKVVRGCGLNGHYWIFGAPTTTLGFELIVEDIFAKNLGASRSQYQYTVVNSDGNTATAFADIEAFGTCDF